MSEADMGDTSGYREEPRQFLSLDHRVTTFSATVMLGSGPVWAEIGPALHRAHSEAGDHGKGVAVRTHKESRSGGVVGLGASLKLWRFFALEGRVQYRYVGKIEVGPYPLQGISFEAEEADFSHFFFGLGIGFRL